MRILLAPAGSRGDFQPHLALAIGLKRAGHLPLIASGECFRKECEAFDIPFVRAGIDVQQFIEDPEHRRSFTPLRATVELLGIGRREVATFIRELVEPCRHVDVVIGGGAQIAAPTAAQVAGKPYVFIAYTPQLFPSAYHPPFTVPVLGLPRWGNRLLWSLSSVMTEAALRGPIDAVRKELELPPLVDLNHYLFPKGRALLACDPELTPLPPDLGLAFPAIGSLHLDDPRPLPEELEGFLNAGTPPVYVGFGSMPDADAAATSQLIVDAVEQAGCRAVLSSGWGGLGGVVVPPQINVVGPVSHSALFPRVVAIVHHGGAGTTAASARSGRPQLLVPHAFDQLALGRHVERAGLGPAPIPRTSLTVGRLAKGLKQLVEQPEWAQRATALGDVIRRRDPVKTFLEHLDRPGWLEAA